MPRVNFTDRKRIEHHLVDIHVARSDHGATANVRRLDLAGKELPDDAAVWLEAQFGSMGLQRFSLGTVGEPSLGADLDILGQGVYNVRFRVKVVASASGGSRLLAVADDLRPPVDGDAEASSLLPVRPSSDLGQMVWNLSFENDEPVLQVNAELGDWKGVVAGGRFQALVFPQVVRQIAIWLLARQAGDPGEDSIQGRWIRYFGSVGADHSEVPDLEDYDGDLGSWFELLDEWADQAARQVARQHRALGAFSASSEGGVA